MELYTKATPEQFKWYAYTHLNANGKDAARLLIRLFLSQYPRNRKVIISQWNIEFFAWVDKNKEWITDDKETEYAQT